jgi:hypothetical protein
MELAIGLILLVAVGYVLYLNNRKPSTSQDVAPAPSAEPEAPYKVETPVVQEIAPVVETVVAPAPVVETVVAPAPVVEAVKKPRKPRAVAAPAKSVKPVKKAPAMKATKGKSKKT